MDSQESKNTRLDNSTYNVMAALGREADFLHSSIDTYIADAERENKTNLVEVWSNIKQDKQEHLDKSKNCLEKEKDISIKSKAFMSNGIREIISNSDGVKPAYCRTGLT
jgi:hypothetical protein